MEKLLTDSINLSGLVKFTLAKGNPEMEARILAMKSAGQNPLDLIRKHNEEKTIKTLEQKNVVATVFHATIANYIANINPTNSILIEYAALGSGNSTPAIGNTTLDTEVYRKEISSLSNAGKVVYATVFYSSTDIDGTFYEHAFFCNATNIANSGVLVSRVLVDAPTGIAKSNTETLTIDYTLTIQ